MNVNRPASTAASRRAIGTLGRPRLLIVGCGDIGLRIVARLNRRFRVVALTSSPQFRWSATWTTARRCGGCAASARA
jgi:threonine dehydrogenase-like Zn-dependent dehydrogenase